MPARAKVKKRDAGAAEDGPGPAGGEAPAARAGAPHCAGCAQGAGACHAELEGLAGLPKVSPPNRYPFCLVWTPIPFACWLFPFLGHAGVGQSTGYIQDFAQSFIVSQDNFAFGRPFKYLQLDPHEALGWGEAEGRGLNVEEFWNEGMKAAVLDFQHRHYSFWSTNCHSFAAACLNGMGCQGRRDWTVFDLAVLILARGRYVYRGFAVAHAVPWLLTMGLGGYVGGLRFLAAWGLAAGAIVAWYFWTSRRGRRTRRKSRTGLGGPEYSAV